MIYAAPYLLASIHRLHTHLDQTVFGLAVRKNADGRNGLVGVFLS